MRRFPGNRPEEVVFQLSIDGRSRSVWPVSPAGRYGALRAPFGPASRRRTGASPPAYDGDIARPIDTGRLPSQVAEYLEATR